MKMSILFPLLIHSFIESAATLRLEAHRWPSPGRRYEEALKPKHWKADSSGKTPPKDPLFDEGLLRSFAHRNLPRVSATCRNLPPQQQRASTASRATTGLEWKS